MLRFVEQVFQDPALCSSTNHMIKIHTIVSQTTTKTWSNPATEDFLFQGRRTDKDQDEVRWMGDSQVNFQLTTTFL